MIAAADRIELEATVRTFGYTDTEIKTFTTEELELCIAFNLDRPDPDYHYDN